MNEERLIQKLKQDIAQSRIVIIAGTGVSIAACGNQMIEGHPVASWVGLLQHGLEYCRRLGLDNKDAKLLGDQIKSNRVNYLVSVAQEISQRLQSRSPGTYRDWLENAIGKLVPEHPAILDAINGLPGVLATLNYDGLFENATHRQPVTWLRPDKVQKTLLGDFTNAILHLHGYFDEPESIVLGFASYAKVAIDPHASAVLRSFLIDRSLLFVGCGGTVKDPNFSRLVEWAKDALKEIPPRHLLLCREEELESVRADLASAPWLQPLIYGRDYKELAPFLRSLAPPGPAGATILQPMRADVGPYNQAKREREPDGESAADQLDQLSRNLTILHVSDMQFGRHHQFPQEPEAPPNEFDNLLNRLWDDIELLRHEENLQPDLLICIGDLAEWAWPKEFEEATRFLGELAERLGLKRNRVVIIPGNHDVHRKECLRYFEQCIESGDKIVPPWYPKWSAYQAAFDKFYESFPAIRFTPDEPWSLFIYEDLKVVVAGLNSTWSEGHDWPTDGSLPDFPKHERPRHFDYCQERQLRSFAASLGGGAIPRLVEDRRRSSQSGARRTRR